MNTDEYKTLVINLFKSGNATDEQWDAMAEAVLIASEEETGVVNSIDICVDSGYRLSCDDIFEPPHEET